MTKEELSIIIKRESAPIVALAEKLEIKTIADLEVAVGYRVQIKDFLKKVTTEKEKITRPALDLIAVERGRWKPFEAMYESALDLLNKRMGAFNQEQDRIAREEEEKIAARIKPGKGNLSIEKGIEKMAEVEKVPERVVSNMGSVRFQEVKCFEVMDVTMLPKEYIVANEVLIRKAMLAGTEISGVRYFVESRPVSSR